MEVATRFRRSGGIARPSPPERVSLMARHPTARVRPGSGPGRPEPARLGKLHPGIDPVIEHVDHEVDRHEDHGDEEDNGLDDRVIPSEDRIDGEAAEARPREGRSR